MFLVKSHTPGKSRYFTYWLEWPDGTQPWVDQVEFVHDLQFELKNTRFMKDPMMPPHIATDLVRKGEARWMDSNGVTHRVVIEETKRNRRWGVKRK